MHTPNGPIELYWWKDKDRLSMPDGYEVEVHNISHRPLMRGPCTGTFRARKRHLAAKNQVLWSSLNGS